MRSSIILPLSKINFSAVYFFTLVLKNKQTAVNLFLMSQNTQASDSCVLTHESDACKKRIM